MVARLPGFEITGGNSDDRGFGQASLNILINGRRPSSKSSRANQILGRIPANNVKRIEILDGATLDIPGLSGQVANIVAKTGDFSGRGNYAVRFEEGSKPQLGDGGVSFSTKYKNIDVVGELDFGQFIFTENGDETFFDGAGNITQDRVEKVGFNQQRPRGNLNFTLARDNGDIANLNISGSRRNRNTAIQESFQDRTNPLFSGVSHIDAGSDVDTAEISGDYSFDAPLLGRDGRLKIIALKRQETLDFTQNFIFFDGSFGDYFEAFTREDTTNETIGRAEYTWKTGQNTDWSLSLEGALNALDSDTSLAQNFGTPDLENVRVEEQRYQTSLSRSWEASDRINVQASLGAEYSIIDVKTTTDPSQDIFRPKGLLSVSYALNDSWSLRSQVERRVGQLDFDDFVSTVSLTDGTANKGATRIVPEQSWDSEIELEKQSTTGLSGRASLFFNIVEDRVEQLAFIDADGEITQGSGNLPTTAQVYGAQANLTWILDDLLKGLRVSASGRVASSSVEDPITFETREINGQSNWNYELEARWDVDNTPYAIEVEIEQGDGSDVYRVDERSRSEFIRPEFEIGLIHKDFLGMQWRATFQNIVDFDFRRERFIFDETRNGDLIGRELRSRKRGQRFSLSVTDSF